MKILLCNKFYYRRGGDCVYNLNLEDLLRANGHEVAVFSMEHPDTLDTRWRKYFPSEVNLSSASSKLRFLFRSIGDRETASKFTALLDAFEPDVVHVGNIHSQLSPIIVEIAHRRGIRVVWTLHDYKLLCPRYDCLRGGKEPCQLCFGNKINVLKYRCMKDSLPASVMAYLEAQKWSRARLEASTDAFICPSRFMLAKMAQGGFDESRLHHLCNFFDVSRCSCDDYSEREDYYCYVGRLSTEKGVKTLAAVAAGLPYRLVVVGDGPLGDSLPQAPNIVYTGRKDWTEIKEIVRKARFLVIPSECFENNPLSVIEAKCLGTPVLGARIGGIPELIDEGREGMCFKSGDQEDLGLSIERMFSLKFDYGSIAAGAQEEYSGEAYLNKLLKIYSTRA